jgi:DUF1365 family protein
VRGFFAQRSDALRATPYLLFREIRRFNRQAPQIAARDFAVLFLQPLELDLLLRARSDAERNGVTIPEGQIFLLTHLRYLGCVFNSVSFFYFYDAGGNLRQMMAEVNNTFGESRNYWLTPQEKTNTAAPATM